ncbi:MAG: argininosuccinate lyase [Deltaproteobacteria bacterium]|nr:argininosuccinate lyase [Deltaproteobacteria bacterium]
MNLKNKKTQVWGSRISTAPNQANILFCAGRDVTALPMADEQLIEYDIWTNLAHARMLYKIKVLNQNEFHDLNNALLDLEDSRQRGEFKLDPEKEDVHINIEHYLTNVKGIQAGKKIHTARSRNDQVSTDMRLFIREQVLILIEGLIGLAHEILNAARGEKKSIMPGFTHYQPAMITTAAHWLTSWSQGTLRDIQRFFDDFDILNYSPLGSAAAFGTSWPIDREYTADLLGFNGVDENTLDCISSRGENESRIASSVSVMMNHLGTIAQDIILLASPYYDMLRVDDKFVTGSSIMPQKRNLDFAELIRSKSAQSHGILVSLLGIQKGSMSGYNRDSQQTKYLIMDLFREVNQTPLILSGIIQTMQFNRKKMKSHCSVGFIESADIADWLANKYALPFRDTYNILSGAVNLSDKKGKLDYKSLMNGIKEAGFKLEFSEKELKSYIQPSNLIRFKTHIGGPSPKSVQKMITLQSNKLKQFQTKLEKFQERISNARKTCFNREDL